MAINRLRAIPACGWLARASAVAFVASCTLLLLADRASADPSTVDLEASEIVSVLGDLPLGSMIEIEISIVDGEGAPVPGLDVSLWTEVDSGDGPVDFMFASNHPDCVQFGENSPTPFCAAYDADQGRYVASLIAGALGPQTVRAYLGFALEVSPGVFAPDQDGFVGSVSGFIHPPAGTP